MEPDTFDHTLRAFAQRVPSRSFEVELINSTSFNVTHPEALIYRDGAAVYIAPGGKITIFDHQGVIGLVDPAEKVPG